MYCWLKKTVVVGDHRQVKAGRITGCCSLCCHWQLQVFDKGQSNLRAVCYSGSGISNADLNPQIEYFCPSTEADWKTNRGRTQ